MSSISLCLQSDQGAEAICPDFKQRFPETWGRCFATMATTRTLAARFWCAAANDLGWPDLQTALTAFEKPDDDWSAAPIDTWEDNTRLLQWESARDGKARNLAYLVSSMPDEGYIPEPGTDPDYPARSAKGQSQASLMDRERLPILWPDSTGMRWRRPTARQDPRASTISVLPAQYQSVGALHPRRAGQRPSPTLAGRFGDRQLVSRRRLGALRRKCGVSRSRGDRGPDGCASERKATWSYRVTDEIPMGLSADRRTAFVNTADKLKSAAAGGVGKIEAYCAIISLPTDLIKAMLPAGLRLVAPKDWSLTNYHPFVLTFCGQRHVRPGFVPFGGVDYHEFIELIPSVERQDPDAPTGGPWLMPRLLLDNLIPIVVGTNFYGFNKRLARITSRGGGLDIRGDFGEIRAIFDRVTLPGTIGRFSTIEDASDLLKMPLISQLRPGRGSIPISTISSKLPFQLVDGRIEFDTPAVQPFSRQVKSDQAPAGCPAGPWFRLSTNWRLSGPLTSGQISGHDRAGQVRNATAHLRRARNRTLF